METRQKVYGIIIAAGRSQRMGSPKPFIKIRGETFIERIAGNIRNSGAARPGAIIYNPEHLRRLNDLQLPGFDLIPNDRIEWGPLYSIQLGLSGIPKDASAFLLCLVDHPFVDQETYRKLIRSHRRFQQNVLIPIDKGRRGHPALFPFPLFSDILQLPPDLEGGLQTFMKDRPGLILEVPVNDPGILADIDRPEDCINFVKE